MSEQNSKLELTTTATEEKATKTALKRVTFLINNTDLDAYEPTKGHYKLSVAQVAKAANLDPKRLPQIWERKDMKALLGADFSVPQTYTKTLVETVDGIRQASLIDLKYATLIWMYCNTVEGTLLASACIMEALESRILNAAGKKQYTFEEREIIFHYRAAPVTVEKRKEIQKQLSKTYSAHSRCEAEWARITNPEAIHENLGKMATELINLAVFGQRHFKCCRSKYMTPDSQAAIAEIEFHITALELQNPNTPIMSHVQTAIDKHKSVYGERYFLEENKSGNNQTTK
jgi:hypothetical protein